MAVMAMTGVEGKGDGFGQSINHSAGMWDVGCGMWDVSVVRRREAG